MSAEKVVSFDDPPVNEVALGRTFLPRADFLLPHFGGFWQKVFSKFPRAEHAPPIISQTNPDFSADPYFLPRVWLVSSDGTMLLQVQRDRFHFNWRQTDMATDYVRFPTIHAQFMSAWTEFERYVAEVTGVPLQTTTGELSYVNFIALDGVETPIEILDRALVDLQGAPSPRFLPRPTAFNLAYSYQMPGFSEVLKVSAVPAKRTSDGRPGVRLELTVSGPCTSDVSFDDWSKRSHDFLVNGFKDITKPEMHELWKFRV